MIVNTDYLQHALPVLLLRKRLAATFSEVQMTQERGREGFSFKDGQNDVNLIFESGELDDEIVVTGSFFVILNEQDNVATEDRVMRVLGQLNIEFKHLEEQLEEIFGE